MLNHKELFFTTIKNLLNRCFLLGKHIHVGLFLANVLKVKIIRKFGLENGCVQWYNLW
jgi:hypothetical protein